MMKLLLFNNDNDDDEDDDAAGSAHLVTRHFWLPGEKFLAMFMH